MPHESIWPIDTTYLHRDEALIWVDVCSAELSIQHSCQQSHLSGGRALQITRRQALAPFHLCAADRRRLVPRLSHPHIGQPSVDMPDNRM